MWRFPAYTAELHTSYGPSYTLRLLGLPPSVVTSDRALIKQMLTGNPLCRRHANDILGAILGEGSMMLLEPAAHLARRRLLLPPVHGERMKTYETLVRELVASELDVGLWARRCASTTARNALRSPSSSPRFLAQTTTSLPASSRRSSTRWPRRSRTSASARLRTVARVWVARTLLEPIEAEGRALPRGTVVIDALTLHRDPELFPEPAALRPERFADGGRPRTPLPARAHRTARAACSARSDARTRARRSRACAVRRVSGLTCAVAWLYDDSRAPGLPRRGSVPGETE